MNSFRKPLAFAALTLLLAVPPVWLDAPSANAHQSQPNHTSQVESRRIANTKVPALKWAKVEGGYRATVSLPLDYDQPRGPQVSVALFKVPATNPVRRLGTLFVNPGGPGSSGVEMAAAAPYFLSDRILERYDVVGFDPRGSNDSTQVRCFSSTRKQVEALTGMSDSFPVTLREQTNYLSSATKLAQACSGYGKTLASSVSTAEVARDLELLRQAVGDRKLNYFGMSYGSYLGQVYANLFPDRVGSMVLDGIIDPVAWSGSGGNSNQPLYLRLKSDQASSTALQEALRRCAKAGPSACPLSNPQADFDRVAKTLKQHGPLQVATEEGLLEISYQDFIDTTLALLYYAEGAELVAELTASIDSLLAPPVGGRNTNSPHLNELAGSMVRTLSGRHRPQPADYNNLIDHYSSVICTDGKSAKQQKTWPSAVAQAERRAPHFAATWGWSDAQCAEQYWTAGDEDAYTGPFNARTANQVLLIGNYWDPATGFANAEASARMLPNSRLLRSDSWGHTAYGTSRCVNDQVDNHLLVGTGTTAKSCVGDVLPFGIASRPGKWTKSTFKRMLDRPGLPPLNRARTPGVSR